MSLLVADDEDGVDHARYVVGTAAADQPISRGDGFSRYGQIRVHSVHESCDRYWMCALRDCRRDAIPARKFIAFCELERREAER
ncbi:hypothetical protein Y710_03945 [Gordonia sp. QH-12]|nr:hypothetical protein Y710_03945 [Gordonia sp. QH-12]